MSELVVVLHFPNSELDASLAASSTATLPMDKARNKHEDTAVVALDVTIKTDVQPTKEVLVVTQAVKSQEEMQSRTFEPGDHVYQWCSLMGIPGVFQHHGIVIHVETIPSDNEGSELEQILTIADFSNFLIPPCNTASVQDTCDASADPSVMKDREEKGRHAGDEAQSIHDSTSNQQQRNVPMLKSMSGMPNGSLGFRGDGCLRIYTTVSTKDHQWHKVIYSESWMKTLLWKRSGTATQTASDPPEIVIQRVFFLMNQSGLYNPKNLISDQETSVIPKYHPIYANCECLAVWCKTGTWSTLQASAMLSHTAVTSVKGTATVAGIAATQTVTVPAAGLWGWFGYTTAVPLTTVYPLIVPAICAYGVVAVGTPAVVLAVAQRKWAETTRKLNDAFHSKLPCDSSIT